jgi:hypothetical protein
LYGRVAPSPHRRHDVLGKLWKVYHLFIDRAEAMFKKIICRVCTSAIAM